MKKRLGFVSNSSSSSFIAFGARLSREDVLDIRKHMIENGTYTEKLEETLENNNDEEEGPDSWDSIYEFLEEVTDDNFINCDGEYVVGNIIATGDDCGCLDEGSLSLKDITKCADELTKKFGIAPDKIKLLYGTYPC